jgi:hypothetical protein
MPKWREKGEKACTWNAKKDAGVTASLPRMYTRRAKAFPRSGSRFPSRFSLCYASPSLNITEALRQLDLSSLEISSSAENKSRARIVFSYFGRHVAVLNESYARFVGSPSPSSFGKRLLVAESLGPTMNYSCSLRESALFCSGSVRGSLATSKRCFFLSLSWNMYARTCVSRDLMFVKQRRP